LNALPEVVQNYPELKRLKDNLESEDGESLSSLVSPQHPGGAKNGDAKVSREQPYSTQENEKHNLSL
jgi:hypothetical protein